MVDKCAVATGNAYAHPGDSVGARATSLLQLGGYIERHTTGGWIITQRTRSILEPLVPISNSFPVFAIRRHIAISDSTQWDLVLQLADQQWEMVELPEGRAAAKPSYKRDGEKLWYSRRDKAPDMFYLRALLNAPALFGKGCWLNFHCHWQCWQ